MRGIRWVTMICIIPILAGCGLPVVRTQSSVEIQQAKVLLCYVDRTGDKPSVVEHLSVDEDGEVRAVDIANNEGHAPRMMTATPEQFASLQQAVTSSEWQALDEEYGSAADGITYDIHCGGTQLLVHADAERPVVVNNVIQQLETFWQQAEPIN